MRLQTAVAAGFAGISLIAGTLTAAIAAPGNGLVTHRAVYDLELKSASDRSGIDGMFGRMVYEFNGSACEGYTVSFRFVTEVDSGDDSRLTDQQSTTYEDLKNGIFRFNTRSFVNDKLDREIKGMARDKVAKGGKGIEVELQAPARKNVTLVESKFPTAHMLELIDRAEKGETFYQSRIFDGSDDADKSMLTTTVVGPKRNPDQTDAEAAKAGTFAKEPFWPVTIAYFDDATGEGDQTPAYRIAFKLYANGITRDLTMDYGDFVLQGKLAELDVFKQPACKP